MENQELDTMELKDPLDQFESEAAQPVSVGNHNLSDKSFTCKFQNLTKSLPLEVNSGSNIGDDLVIGELLLHMADLALQVIPLADG